MQRAASTWIFALVCAIALLAERPGAAQQPAPPGQFDYYLLALSWSPSFCARHPEAVEECGHARGFVVHGLWPQNLDGSWPAFCRPVAPVPTALAAREADTIMPDAELIEHEWSKHGSCTTDTAEQYFGHIDRAFAALHIPDALAHPAQPVTASLADAKAAMVAVNPGLEPGMVSLRCGKGGAVEEMRICLDRGLRYRACAADQADACPATLRFPPISPAAR